MFVFGVIQSECGKMRTRITPNTDTFYTVLITTKKVKIVDYDADNSKRKKLSKFLIAVLIIPNVHFLDL